MSRKRYDVAVLIAVLIVFFSLLFLAVSRAQTQARKQSSQRNLKSIALGVLNHESAFKSLPAGCDNQAKHGWMTFIFPFMEASPWYNSVDFDVSWEHPLNKSQFFTCMDWYKNPGQPMKFTSEGFGITDYHGNPALLYRGSKTKLSGLEAGQSSVWLAGEIKGDQTPFGYPFNWRELKPPINHGAQSFGGWSDGASVAFVDGSVKFLSSQADDSVLRALAEAAPLPSQELLQRPDRRFDLTAHSLRSKRVHSIEKGPPSKGGPPYSVVWFDTVGQPEFIDFAHGIVEVDKTIAMYPQSRILRTRYPRSSEELDWICSLKSLETLCLMHSHQPAETSKSLNLDLKEVIIRLQKIPTLKCLKLTIDEDKLLLVKELLPSCEVIPSSM